MVEYNKSKYKNLYEDFTERIQGNNNKECVKMYAADERKRILAKAFWDKEIDLDLLDSFVIGEIDSIPLVSSKSIFIKLLSTFDWYTLMWLLPKKTLKKALADDVLNNLFPRTRKEKYRYARQILFL